MSTDWWPITVAARGACDRVLRPQGAAPKAGHHQPRLASVPAAPTISRTRPPVSCMGDACLAAPTPAAQRECAPPLDDGCPSRPLANVQVLQAACHVDRL